MAFETGSFDQTSGYLLERAEDVTQLGVFIAAALAVIGALLATAGGIKMAGRAVGRKGVAAGA